MSVTKNEPVLQSFLQLVQKFKEAWIAGRIAAEEAKKNLNSAIRVMHSENPTYSLHKILSKIAQECSDLEGFSVRQLYRELDQENINLKQKSLSYGKGLFHNKVPKDNEDIKDDTNADELIPPIHSTTQEKTETKLSKIGLLPPRYQEEKPSYEDLQIKLNDAQVLLSVVETTKNELSQLLEKEREARKKEREEYGKANFQPASEIKTKDEEDSIPYSQHIQVVGNLNSRILELKEKLSSAEKKEHRLEFGDKIIVIVTEAIGLKSITIDEAKTRRLNQ